MAAKGQTRSSRVSAPRPLSRRQRNPNGRRAMSQLRHKRKKVSPPTLVAIVPTARIEHAFVHDEASQSGSLGAVGQVIIAGTILSWPFRLGELRQELCYGGGRKDATATGSRPSRQMVI